jgi:hypothetical protein
LCAYFNERFWSEGTSGHLESSDWFAALNGSICGGRDETACQRKVLFWTVLCVGTSPHMEHNSANFLRHDIEVEANAQVQLIHWSPRPAIQQLAWSIS